MAGGSANAAKVVGAPYTSGGEGPVRTCKAVVNEWFASVAAIHLENASQEEGRLRGAGGAPPGDHQHHEPWALVLDTASLATVRALARAGVVAPNRCVVPNPDEAVAAAADQAGAHGLVATSHQLLMPDGPVHPLVTGRQRRGGMATDVAAAADPTADNRTTKASFADHPSGSRKEEDAPREKPPPPPPSPESDERGSPPSLVGFPSAARGAVGCAWLDYCGGISSRVGRRRREDVYALMAAAAPAGNTIAETPSCRPWLAPHAIVALTVSERGAPALYDGDSLDAAVLLVCDAAARGGRRAAVVGTCSYVQRGGDGVLAGGRSKRTGRAAKMHTLIFAVAPQAFGGCSRGGASGGGGGRGDRGGASEGDGGVGWLEAQVARLPAPPPADGMVMTVGWALKLAGVGTGAGAENETFLRDAAMQHAAAASFAAAAAAAIGSSASSYPPPWYIALESRLLPAVKALRNVLPKARVSVVVEDDLERLVATAVAARLSTSCSTPCSTSSTTSTFSSFSSSSAVQVKARFWDLLTDVGGDSGGRTRREGGAEKGEGEMDGDLAQEALSGAFLDYTGRTRAFARAELAACAVWPQLAAVLRSFQYSRGGGVVAMLVNVSDDVEYWEGLAVDYLVHGLRVAAADVASSAGCVARDECAGGPAGTGAGCDRGKDAMAQRCVAATAALVAAAETEKEVKVEVLEVMSTTSGMTPRVMILASVSFHPRVLTTTMSATTEGAVESGAAGAAAAVATQPSSPSPCTHASLALQRGWDEARVKHMAGATAVAIASWAIPAVEALATELGYSQHSYASANPRESMSGASSVSSSGSSSRTLKKDEAGARGWPKARDIDTPLCAQLPGVMVAEPGGLGVTPALLALGYQVEAVACDPVHYLDEARRHRNGYFGGSATGDSDDAPGGGGTAARTSRVHESPWAAAAALDDGSSMAMATTTGGEDDGLPPILLLLMPIHDTGNRQQGGQASGWEALVGAWAQLCMRRRGRGYGRGHGRGGVNKSGNVESSDSGGSEAGGGGVGGEGDSDPAKGINVSAVALSGIVVLVDATKGQEAAAATARHALAAAFIGRARPAPASPTGDVEEKWRVDVSRVAAHASRCRRYALVTLTVTPWHTCAA